MKKIILLAGIACFAVSTVNAAVVVRSFSILNIVSEWEKSKEGTWDGMHDGKKVWYKLNQKDASLWWSMDGKKWEAVKEGMWQDKDGKWLKIVDAKMLKWSADGGKTWSDVPEWKWEAPSGTWYKFDKDWSLWMNGAKK
jgi:opacity protein-like surface antigen